MMPTRRLKISMSFAGVPKHSELEPDYCLVKGNGTPSQLLPEGSGLLGRVRLK